MQTDQPTELLTELVNRIYVRGRRRGAVRLDVKEDGYVLKHAGLMSVLYITRFNGQYKVEDEYLGNIVASHDNVDEETMLALVDRWLAVHR